MKKPSGPISSPSEKIASPPLIETPLLIETQAGFRISYHGKELIPAGSVELLQKKAQALLLEPETLYVFCSPLFWHGIFEIVSRLPSSSNLVIIELDPQLRNLVNWQKECSRYSNHSNIKFSFQDTIAPVCLDIVSQFQRSTRRVRFISINGGRYVHAQGYREIEQKIEIELRRYWRNRTTLLFMGPLWIRNFFNNLCSTRKPQDIADFSPFEHVVICGAGPSLESSIPLLRQFCSKIYLVAVDTALPILHAYGLIPDLVVALDGQIANLEDFIPAWRNVKAIAYDIVSNPVVARACKQINAWHFSSNFAEGQHWKRATDFGILPTRIPPLGSVGVTAVYLCRFLSSRHIYITGLDFSYSPGLTHARHSPAYSKYLIRISRLSGSFPETASLGEKIIRDLDDTDPGLCTDPVLISYRDSLDDVIQFLQEEGKIVHDIRKFGLPIAAPGLDETGFAKLVESRATNDGISKEYRIQNDHSHRQFLITILQDIEECMKSINSILENDAELLPELGNHTLSLLSGLDFLFYDFADKIWPNLEPDALARAYIKLGYFQKFINRRINPHPI